MNSNSEAVFRNDLQRAMHLLESAQDHADAARRILREIMPLLKGKRIKYGGIEHMIVNVGIGFGNQIILTGVRCNGNKIGKRQFHCGYLKRIDELYDGKDTQRK